jgi:monothiol glutaredoxin
MARSLLSESNVHEKIQAKIGGGHQSVINEVMRAVNTNNVLVVGMRQNPVCKSVKKNLKEANIAFEYLEYGSYLSQWKPRLAIKMWSGWPTFPMVFVNGNLIGGNYELEGLLSSGEVKN